MHCSNSRRNVIHGGHLESPGRTFPAGVPLLKTQPDVRGLCVGTLSADSEDSFGWQGASSYHVGCQASRIVVLFDI